MVSAATVYFDGGGQRGQPCVAAAVVQVEGKPGPITAARVIPSGGTNNVAEYEALVLGLEKALEYGARRVQAFGDSLLVVRQVRGEWAVKNPRLVELRLRARRLLERFERWGVAHVPREENVEADALGRSALDAWKVSR